MATTTTAPVRMLSSLHQIKVTAANAGSHWFDPAALRYFSSRISLTVYPVPGGALFISSEQFRPLYAAPEPRLYSVRSCTLAGNIDTVGEFQQYRTRAAAHAAAARMRREGFSLV